MKLQYKGALKNHGDHTIHQSFDIVCEEVPEEKISSTKHVTISADGRATYLRFDGSANMNKSSLYEFTLTLEDDDLLTAYSMRFGIDKSPADIKAEIYKENLKVEAPEPTFRPKRQPRWPSPRVIEADQK